LYLPFKIFSKKIDFHNITPKKILVIRLDHVGDVVMTSPAFSMLRDRFPKAKIFLLADSVSQQLFNEDPRFDDILVFNWPWVHQKKNNRFSFSKVKELIRMIIRLRKERIDLFVDFRGDLRFIILFGVLTGAKIRIGNSRSGETSLLHYCSVYDNDKHEVERVMDVIKCFDITNPKPRPELFLNDTETYLIKKFVKNETKLSDFPAKLALIAPYSSKDIKSWPVAYFKEVIDYLLSKNFAVIVVGTEDDEENAREMISGFHTNVFSFAGKTSVRQLAALTSVSTVIVGVDTGVLHIASCFNIPIVAIFGPTRSVEFRPYSPHSSLVQTNTCHCNQFLHAKCDCSVEGYANCLFKLTPAPVIQAISNIITQCCQPGL